MQQQFLLSEHSSAQLRDKPEPTRTCLNHGEGSCSPHEVLGLPWGKQAALKGSSLRSLQLSTEEWEAVLISWIHPPAYLSLGSSTSGRIYTRRCLHSSSLLLHGSIAWHEAWRDTTAQSASPKSCAGMLPCINTGYCAVIWYLCRQVLNDGTVTTQPA